ncbi:hypothetical protein BALOs_1860 [Halobacteriovorax sp. BALOs_7]|uniref:hypothetical protein n=1 Tax=Halobacteriovorax sp. BALOs_7 TaxID=2109558 RepID=UPI000EB69BC1|nr:hypothetical protein [Halobacteriovorax sp. BALOs_7]AYF44860.1 hypothetical protein BALOs_1860 [Halobacteriovorax sp. BALOs_7]
MNLKERLKLEEKECKNLIQAYWRFRKRPDAKKKGEEEDQELGAGDELVKQLGPILEN